MRGEKGGKSDPRVRFLVKQRALESEGRYPRGVALTSIIPFPLKKATRGGAVVHAIPATSRTSSFLLFHYPLADTPYQTNP